MAAHRHIWMDAIRGGAILLVLVDHAAQILTVHGLTMPRELAFFTAAVSPYRMPLLMYLSGLLLQRSLSKPWKHFALGKLRNIGWPYLVWSVITLSATTGITVVALLQIPVVSPTFLWFLWFIMAFYVIGWVCNRIGLDPLLVATLALLASAVLPDFARASRFAYLLFFFMLGHAVISRSMTFKQSGTARRLLLLGCVIGVLITSGLAVRGHDVRYEAPYVFGPLALMVLVQALSGYYRNSRAFAPLEYVGRNSLVFYVVHYSVEWLIIVAAIGLGFSSGRAIFAVAFGVALVSGIAFCYLRDRWQPAGWLFAFPARTSAQGAVRV